MGLTRTHALILWSFLGIFVVGLMTSGRVGAAELDPVSPKRIAEADNPGLRVEASVSPLQATAGQVIRFTAKVTILTNRPEELHPMPILLMGPGGKEFHRTRPFPPVGETLEYEPGDERTFTEEWTIPPSTPPGIYWVKGFTPGAATTVKQMLQINEPVQVALTPAPSTPRSMISQREIRKIVAGYAKNPSAKAETIASSMLVKKRKKGTLQTLDVFEVRLQDASPKPVERVLWLDPYSGDVLNEKHPWLLESPTSPEVVEPPPAKIKKEPSKK